MSRYKFESHEIRDVPLEHMRLLIEALQHRLGLKLERRKEFYGEPEYRFVGVNDQEVIDALKRQK